MIQPGGWVWRPGAAVREAAGAQIIAPSSVVKWSQLRRRNLGQDQHDSAAGMRRAGQVADRQSSVRHWNTMAFVATLRHDAVTAHWVNDGPVSASQRRDIQDLCRTGSGPDPAQGRQPCVGKMIPRIISSSQEAWTGSAIHRRSDALKRNDHRFIRDRQHSPSVPTGVRHLTV